MCDKGVTCRRPALISSSDSLVFSRACAAAGGSVWKRASRSAADAKMGLRHQQQLRARLLQRLNHLPSRSHPKLQDTDTQRP